jgi:hypothetical protein
MYSRREYYRPEYYRRLGLAAKQRAAHSTDPNVKEACAITTSKANKNDDAQQALGKLPFACRPMSKSALTASTEEERADLLSRAKTWDFLADHCSQQHLRN